MCIICESTREEKYLKNEYLKKKISVSMLYGIVSVGFCGKYPLIVF